LRPCGDWATAEVGEGIVIGRELGGTSYRRDALTKRGDWAVEEAEVRREAWYARAGVWKAVEGDGGAEIVGEDEASMSRLRVQARVVRCGC
jgi:hypothetical protein